MSHTAVELPRGGRWHREAADFWPAACVLALGSVPIVLLGFQDGGYHDGAWRLAGIALAAVAGLRLVLPPRPALGRAGILSVAALSGLAAWMLLSSGWGIDGTEAQREAERCAVYALWLLAVLSVVGPATSGALLTGVLGGIVLLAVAGLADRLLSPPAPDPYQGSLLIEPVGYANALGMLMALGVVLALGELHDPQRRLRRGALLGAAGLSAVALALTSSRGAWLAALAGLGVLLAFRCRTWRAPALAAGAVAATAVLIVATTGPPRASLGDRPEYWRVAVSAAADQPLLGSGAGSFDDYWLEHRTIPAYVRDAHSLYLETVAELGMVGLALLLVALGAPLAAVARARDRRRVATAASAYVAFLVHAGLDWDWEMPVTTFAGLACGGALLVAARAS